MQLTGTSSRSPPLRNQQGMTAAEAHPATATPVHGPHSCGQRLEAAPMHGALSGRVSVGGGRIVAGSPDHPRVWDDR